MWDSAWLRILREGNFEFIIVARKKEDRKFRYQVTDLAMGNCIRQVNG
jgi:hypothetical protein